MNEAAVSRPPAWYWGAAILAMVWNLVGVAMYLQSIGMFGDPLTGLNEVERSLAQSVPSWVTIAFAVATISGGFGALGLVLLKRWAKPLLSLSLVAVLVQETWILFFSDATQVHGSTAVGMPVLVTAVALLLVWLGNHALRRGWLN